MTRETYLGMLENALEQFDRYRAMYPRNAHIVFVVSRSVMAAIRAYEANNIESFYDTFQEPHEMRTYLKLRGIDVCMAIGCDDDIFSPAFVWNEDVGEIRLSNDRLLNGDLLIDGRQLYIYDSEQITYRDTGYSVESGIGMEYSYAGNISADAISTGSFVDPAIGFREPWDSFDSPRSWVASSLSATMGSLHGTGVGTGVDYSELFDRIFNGKRKKNKVESELDPGDTKAIDDYLNSFARHESQSMLREA